MNLAYVDDSRHDLEKILGIDVAVADLPLESEVDARAARSLVTGSDFRGVLAASTALPAAAQVKFHPVLVHPHVSDGFPFIGVHTHTPGLQPLAQRAQVNAALD